MSSRFRPQEAISIVLDALRNDGLRRLCEKRDIPYGRSDSDRRERLAGEYRGAVAELLADLRRPDLVSALGDVTFEVNGKEYQLGRLHKATLGQLRDAAAAVFVGDWEPSGKGDGPVPNSPIDAYEIESDGVSDDADDEGREGWPEHEWPSLLAGDDDLADVIRDVDDEPERQETKLESVEDVDPLASSPEGRHDASLTDFQLEAVAALDRHFSQPGARGLLCLPTGGGKTRTSLDWLLRRFVARGERVLWVTHRIDLLNQVHEEIRGLGWLLRHARPDGFTVSRYQGGHDDLSGDIVLASAATLQHRRPSRRDLSRRGRLGIVVYDEAHRAVATGTWRALSKLLGRGEVPFLGLTATPFRTERDGTARIAENLGGSVYQRTFKELIDVGFLARPVFVRQQLRSTEGFLIRQKEMAEIQKLRELTPGVLGRLAREPRRNAEILDHWLRERRTYGKTLAFACNVKHAERMAELFRQKDVRADFLHSDLPMRDRARRLAAFRDGDLDVLVNVGILTEGANVPDTQTVLMARPTMSTSLYMQMIGRGARGPRTVPGKTQFYVIDCVDNFAQHGLLLAGGEVANRLAVDPTTRPATPRTRTAAEERAERRELTAAAAWLAARGFDPRAYSFWGELRWESPSGPASVAVFTETYAPVDEAVRLARDAVATGRWSLARDRAPHLEAIGALRAVDWARVVSDCQRARLAPRLIPVPDLKLNDEDLEVAGELQRLVAKLRAEGFDAAMVAADQLWALSPAASARFASTAELRQEVMNLGSAQVHAGVVAPPRPAQAPDAAPLEAFVEIALSIARADGTVDDAERLTILRGAERLFAVSDHDIAQHAQTALERKEDSAALDARRAIATLREAFDWPARLVAFDLLFRVALADGRLAEEERVLLESCAAGLELPREELTDRLQWFQAAQPTPAAPAVLGFRTCPSCSAAFEGAPNFCGYCGTSMTAHR